MRLHFVGNASSPHVRTWVRALRPSSAITIYDINRSNELADVEGGASVIRPVWSIIPRKYKILQYICLGIALRFIASDPILHAHNTSGYGLSAWISGKKFIVTTYGTEIYQAGQRGWLYNWIVRRVLKRSSMITASTPFMKRTLESHFGVPAKKVFCRMVVDQVFINAGAAAKRTGPRSWFVNRRMTELYCTLEVIAAFKAFLHSGGQGELIVLEGDADPAFANRVAKEIGDSPNIRIVKGFIDQKRIIEELQAAHFAISVPVSDQLSSAIVEAAACQAVPIIRNLPSYGPVAPICITVDDGPGLVAGLTEAFRSTAALSDEALQQMGRSAQEYVLKKFHPEEFRSEFVRRIYEIS